MAFFCAAMIGGGGAALADSPENPGQITYFMDFDEAMRIVPQTRTKWYSEKYDVDLMNHPLPWERQIRNAITDFNGSNTDGDFIGGIESWVPLDPIPGEDNFPINKRISLSAQRGYQDALISGGHFEYDKEIARIGAQHKAIADEARAGIMAEKEKMDADFARTQAAYDARSKANAVAEQNAAAYEQECWAHFSRDDYAGCDIVAASLSRGAAYDEANPLRGRKPGKGDVLVTTPGGQVLLSADDSGWINAYRHGAEKKGVVRFEKAR